MTLMVGYSLGLTAAGYFSATYVYVAIVTGLVCGPNLLSIRRRMPNTESAGAVVVASLGLRAAVIASGALLVICVLKGTGSKEGTVSLATMLFLGRFFETAIDGPATSVQYLRGASAYFILRLTVFLTICGSIGFVVALNPNIGIHGVAACYLMGCALGFLLSLTSTNSQLKRIAGVFAEGRAQTLEFGQFFFATALFLASSRMQPLVIRYFDGESAAGQFAMVQNLFSVLAVASTGIAGVFFWSRNRTKAGANQAGAPWRWLAISIAGGLAIGGVYAAMLDVMYLQPLGSSVEVRRVGWLLCLSTPLILAQTILSNQLILLRRDQKMLRLSILNATVGVCLVIIMACLFGPIGAALSVGITALLSSAVGIYFVRRVDA